MDRVLQVYPALSRRRVLALRLSLLRRAQRDHPSWGLGSQGHETAPPGAR